MFNLQQMQPIRFGVIIALIIYIVLLVYYLPPHILQYIDSQAGRFFLFTIIILTALNTPDVALLAAIAFLTTVQVYRNRLALISGTEEKEHDKELKKEIKKEEKQIDEIEKNIQQQEKQI